MGAQALCENCLLHRGSYGNIFCLHGGLSEEPLLCGLPMKRGVVVSHERSRWGLTIVFLSPEAGVGKCML